MTDGQAYLNEDIILPRTLWEKPDYTDLENNQTFKDEGIMTNPSDGRIKSVLINGQPFNGKQTKFYALLGIPENASADNKVPAIVLVHGGFGTAYADWVEMWVDRGYAAIAMDTEGQAPSPGSLMTASFKTFLPEEMRGPQNSGWYQDQDDEVSRQWIYHALCCVISSNSLIRDLDIVDKGNVGITGISWGGLITTLATIYDNRFAFSVPVYGTVNMTGTAANFGQIYKSMAKASDLWDNGSGLAFVTAPVMFINSDTDYHFSPLGTTKSFSSVKYSKILLIPSLQHDQYSGAVIKEIGTFADMVVKKQNMFIKVKTYPGKDIRQIEFERGETDKIEKIELYETESELLTSGTKWNKTLLLPENVLKFVLNSATKHYYLLIKAKDGNRISTGIISL